MDEQRLILVVEDDETTRAFLLDNPYGGRVSGGRRVKGGEGVRGIEVRRPIAVIIALSLEGGGRLGLRGTVLPSAPIRCTKQDSGAKTHLRATRLQGRHEPVPVPPARVRTVALRPGPARYRRTSWRAPTFRARTREWDGYRRRCGSVRGSVHLALGADTLITDDAGLALWSRRAGCTLLVSRQRLLRPAELPSALGDDHPQLPRGYLCAVRRRTPGRTSRSPPFLGCGRATADPGCGGRRGDPGVPAREPRR
jgi:hypothetical protein